MVITGAADALLARGARGAAALVYVDAMVPLPGEGWGSNHAPEVVAARRAAAAANDNALPPPDPRDLGFDGADRDWLLRRQVPHPFGRTASRCPSTASAGPLCRAASSTATARLPDDRRARASACAASPAGASSSCRPATSRWSRGPRCWCSTSWPSRKPENFGAVHFSPARPGAGCCPAPSCARSRRRTAPPRRAATAGATAAPACGWGSGSRSGSSAGR